MDKTVLENQVVIMKALLSLIQFSNLPVYKELEKRIAFTEGRISSMI